jgi:hypothetical protein
MKTKPTTKTAAPFEISNESLEALGDAFGKTAERSQTLVETSLRTWQAEVGHYFEDFTTQGHATLEALSKCQGPMDVLAVEQNWLKDRAQAYLESGMRFAKAFAEVAQSFGQQASVPPQSDSAATPPPPAA